MTARDDDDNVSVLTEENWEEDAEPQPETTDAVSIAPTLGSASNDRPEPLMGGDDHVDERALQQTASQAQPFAAELVVPPPTEEEHPEGSETEPPIDEELSDSLRPAPPPLPSSPASIDSNPRDADENKASSPTFRSTPPLPRTSPHADPFQAIGKQVLGTGIWAAGVLLWAYVVIGEYVVSADLPEFVGFSLMTGILVGTFLHGANRIGTEAMRRVSFGAVLGSAIGILLLTLVGGSSNRSDYQLMSLVMLTAAVALMFAGLQRARPLAHEQLVGFARARRVVLWLLFSANTALVTFALFSQL